MKASDHEQRLRIVEKLHHVSFAAIGIPPVITQHKFNIEALDAVAGAADKVDKVRAKRAMEALTRMSPKTGAFREIFSRSSLNLRLRFLSVMKP